MGMDFDATGKYINGKKKKKKTRWLERIYYY
jgi:hypothetical protein